METWKVNIKTVIRLDALAKALSVTATATWLAGCLSQPVLYQND